MDIVSEIKKLTQSKIINEERNVWTGSKSYNMISKLENGQTGVVVTLFDSQAVARVTLYNMITSTVMFEYINNFEDVISTLTNFINNYKGNRRVAYACRGIKR